MVQAELYEQWAESFLQLSDFQLATLSFRKVLTVVAARRQPCLACLAIVLDLQVSHHSSPPFCSLGLWPGWQGFPAGLMSACPGALW